MGQEATKPQTKITVPRDIVEFLNNNKLPTNSELISPKPPSILTPILFEYYLNRKLFIEGRQEKLIIKFEKVERMNKICLSLAADAPKKMNGMVELPIKVKESIDSLKEIEKRIKKIEENTQKLKDTFMFIKKNVLK